MKIIYSLMLFHTYESYFDMIVKKKNLQKFFFSTFFLCFGFYRLRTERNRTEPKYQWFDFLTIGSVRFATKNRNQTNRFGLNTEPFRGVRRLHRRFDHFSTRRLYEILTRSDHDNVESRVIEHLNKYCHHCQMHEKFLERFSFSIRDSDSEFNFNILVNILYIEARSNENKLVLHLMNEITRF